MAEHKEKRPIPPDYMGDAVYARDDGFHLTLYLSNGVNDYHHIALEDHVFQAVVHYGKRMGWS